MSNLPVGTVVFEDVSKRYRLGALGTLRSTLAALSSRWHGDATCDLWALKDVSFRVEPGESLGLIGPNGAGKTTTLKLLSNITQPTSGRVEVSGRMSSLIELGAGFHPELSGRENIFLNGAILGLKQREIQRKLDAIVAFSELERFIDTPVKRYSSGMYVRLGFAVAAYVEPDVLLVDEVLAVGDASFRQKCMDRINGLLLQGTTVLFVSHNMYLVRRICKYALLLMGGKNQYLGSAEDAITHYETMLGSVFLPSSDSGGMADSVVDGALIITNVSVGNASSEPVSQMKHNEVAIVRVAYRSQGSIHDPITKIRLVHSDGTVAAMMASRYQADTTWTLTGEGVISARIQPIQLATGAYHIEARIIDTTDSEVLASGQSLPFHVAGPSLAHELDRGLYVPNTQWEHTTIRSRS
jgi:lipopolysaccharide transport system ATP-binding protein